MKKAILFSCCILIASFSYSQWSAPLNISPGTTAIATNENAGQCIAVTHDTVRVIYSDHSAAMVNIVFRQSPDAGLTWEPPHILQSSLNCGFTAIANEGSNIHVVWMDSLGSSRASFYTHSADAGLTWQPIVCLDSVTKFWPGIACSGNLVAATLNKDLGGNTEVFIMRSVDNGFTWLPEQQISNAPNRSEDPAINISGKDVHLSWNDKRSGTMNIYYCHSADSGVTWGTETPLTSSDSYSSMVCLDHNHVNVPHGIRTGNFFDVWLAESADTGTTFFPNQQLTNTSAAAELYPFMVRDGGNLHVVYLGGGGTNYIYSGDGGVTWTSPLFLGNSGQPFIAYTGCVLHVIFSNAGQLNYLRNPTGNCASVGIEKNISDENGVTVFQAAGMQALMINCEKKIRAVSILTADGKEIFKAQPTDVVFEMSISTSDFSRGIYFVCVENDGGRVVKKVVMD